MFSDKADEVACGEVRLNMDRSEQEVLLDEVLYYPDESNNLSPSLRGYFLLPETSEVRVHIIKFGRKGSYLSQRTLQR